MKKTCFRYGLGLLLCAMGAAGAQSPARTAIGAGELFVADARASRVVRIDPSSGILAAVATEDKLLLPIGIAIALNGDLIVTDNRAGVLRINPITGSQRFIIACPAFACNAPVRIAVAPDGRLIGVGGAFSPGADRVVLVHPVTGAMTVIASGGLLSNPSDVGIANNGDVYVLDTGRIVRLRYDAASGRWEQSLLAAGGLLRTPRGIAVAGNGELYVADISGSVLRVDPVSGAQAVIVATPSLINYGSLAIAPNGDIFVTGASARDAAVIRLRQDPVTRVWGLRTITAPGQLQEPRAIAVASRPVSTVSLESEKDAYFRRDLAIRQNDNYGLQDFVAVGTGREPPGAPDAMRAALQFKLEKVPAAQLQTATLALTVHSFDNGAASSTYRVEAHRIIDGPLAFWNEGNGFEGSGGPPGAVDPDAASGVAWLGAGDNPDPFALNNETQPGFDPVVAASAAIAQGATRAGDVIYLDITALVAAWLNGSAPNFGIMLTDSTSDGLFRAIRFGAREAQAAGSAGAVAGPQLLIRYKDGDINGDGTVDLNDVQAIMAALNQAAGAQDPRDLDGDALITIRDARQLALLCSRPRCAPM